MKFMQSQIKSLKKNKFGISVMIGYVLLVTFAVVISLVVYQQMKTYIPKENVECEEGVSFFIQDVECVQDGTNFKLNITIKNNGRFAIGGYFIRGANDEDSPNKLTDFSQYLDKNSFSVKGGDLIKFSGPDNSFYPDNPSIINTFILPLEVYSIELIPIRYLVYDNQKKLVSCSKSIVKENVVCE